MRKRNDIVSVNGTCYRILAELTCLTVFSTYFSKIQATRYRPRKTRRHTARKTRFSFADSISLLILLHLTDKIKTPIRPLPNGRIQIFCDAIFSHPDFTVGIGISPIHALTGSRTIPPVGNLTPPRRQRYLVVMFVLYPKK